MSGILNSLKNKAFETALNFLKDQIINPKISEFGTVDLIEYKDKRIKCRVTLLGMEKLPLTVTCSSIVINSDCSLITLKDFTANKEGLQNILNDFSPFSIAIPDNAMARNSLSLVKAVL